ncbi:MAG: hypothetical protein AVDCRST_MAG68-3928, partial [uncultured Gemmatimonadetes bacterium]
GGGRRCTFHSPARHTCCSRGYWTNPEREGVDGEEGAEEGRPRGVGDPAGEDAGHGGAQGDQAHPDQGAHGRCFGGQPGVHREERQEREAGGAQTGSAAQKAV